MTKPKAYYQAYLVLDCLSKEEYALIPKELLEEIKSKMEVDKSITVDSTIPLEKQKIDEKTYDILDRVIRAIEKAYGSDAIDNPDKYASLVTDPPVKEPKDKKYSQKTSTRKQDNIPEEIVIENEKERISIKELKEENLRLEGIISALRNENKKIEEAKQLYYDYKEVVSKKDEIIRDLKNQNDELKKVNEELHQDIQKIPKLFRKIFIKEDKLLSGK